MNRSDLTNLLAQRFALLNRRDAEAAVDLMLDAMTHTLARGQRIEIRGFGSFSISRRAARTGRNPRSGEVVQIPERCVPHFKAGKALREAIAREADGEGSDPAKSLLA
jgi:integration host factor subunit beta